MNNVQKVMVTQITGEAKQTIEDLVAVEMPLTVILNNKELVTMLCSPESLDCLAIGFLFSEGVLENKKEIQKIQVDERTGVVRVETNREDPQLEEKLFKRTITSGCGRGASFYNLSDLQGLTRVNTKLEIPAQALLKVAKEFQQHSQAHRETHGVHSAALLDKNSMLVFCDDIGRHNAVDKVIGQCIIQGISTDNCIIISSGRVSSEIIIKAAKMKIPVLVSKAVPTSIAIRIADTLGITLVGFIRGERMNVYTHDWRITTDYKQ